MLTEATNLARLNPINGLPPMAAILVTKDGTIYHGFNSRKTHPLAKKFGKHSEAICLHAEVDAIRRCVTGGGDTRGASLFVARVHRKSRAPMLAKPCEGCQRALIAFNIGNVEWTI